MVMVLAAHADRMVMVLVGDGDRMVTVLVEGADCSAYACPSFQK